MSEAGETSHARYIARETAVSVAINTALSLVFFLIIFGRAGAVPVWGPGSYVFDFAPQGFVIALMATLVPGLLLRKALARGDLEPASGAPGQAGSLLLRALAVGALGAGVGTGGAAALLALPGAPTIGWGAALAAKLAFGAGLAWVVTRLGLRAVLAKH